MYWYSPAEVWPSILRPCMLTVCNISSDTRRGSQAPSYMSHTNDEYRDRASSLDLLSHTHAYTHAHTHTYTDTYTYTYTHTPVPYPFPCLAFYPQFEDGRQWCISWLYSWQTLVYRASSTWLLCSDISALNISDLVFALNVYRSGLDSQDLV